MINKSKNLLMVLSKKWPTMQN